MWNIFQLLIVMFTKSQAQGEVIDPRRLFNDHSLRLSVSCKTAPLPGEVGEVQYSFYPQVIEAIIAQSS